MSQEIPKDIPLIYPLVEIIMRTVTIVDGNRVAQEGAEVVNIKTVTPKDLGKLANDFRQYVNAVTRAAMSQPTRDAIQRIRDTEPPAKWRSPIDPQALPVSSAASDQGSTPTGLLPAVPDKASL